MARTECAMQARLLYAFLTMKKHSSTLTGRGQSTVSFVILDSIGWIKQHLCIVCYLGDVIIDAITRLPV